MLRIAIWPTAPLARFLPVAVALLLAPGCWNSESTFQQQVLSCANLEGAKRSSLPKLAETARIIEAGGGSPTRLTTPPGDDATNAAAGVAKAMTDSTRLRLLPQLEALTRPQGDVLLEERLTLMRGVMKKEKKLFAAVQEAAARPRCASGVRFEQGFFDRYGFLDDAAVAARLHMVAAYVAQQDNNPEGCLLQTSSAAKWIQWLAQEHRLEARLLATQLRSEWFELIQSIAGRSVETAALESLYVSLRSQLDNWPPDRNAFVGDRAMTMHAYEAIRLGMRDRVITSKEEKLLKESGVIDVVASMDVPGIDRDEMTYLETIGEVIDACDKPYYQRVERLAPLFDRTATGNAGWQAAPMATRLFLAGVPEALERVARDRALAEGWALAIAKAGQFDLPPYRTNPLNGKPYEAERSAEGVTLKLGDIEAADPFVKIPTTLSGR